MKEQRIVFGAQDILKMRVICPDEKCKGETVFSLKGPGPSFRAKSIDCCPICNNRRLERADLTVMERAFRALREAKRMGDGESHEASLIVSFEIAYPK